EVYVCQPPSFEDPQLPDKVYKVEKALYGLHQAPRAWYETLSTYLLENGFRRGNIYKTLFIKKDKDDVQEIPDEFYGRAHFLLMVTMKRIFRYLKGQPKLGLWYPRDSPFDLEAFSNSDYARASLDRTSTTGVWFEDSISNEFGVKTGGCKVNAARQDLFADQHNMIACLEKSEGNADFHEIVDFLTASSIHYALTITLAEPFNDVYQTPAHTKKVFTNMKRKGKDFSGRVTPLFASMLAPPVVEGEADEAIFKEWDDRVARATTTAASLDAAQASGNISKTQSTAMSNDPISHKIGLGDRPRCQEAMRGVITQTRSERASKHSYDSLLPGGNTPRSDEERIEQDDLMDFVPPTPHDSPLLGGHTPGSDEDCSRFGDQKAKKEGQKIGKEVKGKNSRDELFKIGTSRRKSLDKENVSKQGRKSDKTKPMFDDSNFAELDVDNAMENVEVCGPSNVSTADPSTSTAGDIFEDEMMTIADTLVAIRSTRPRTASVVICNVEEEPRRATPVPTVQSQDKGKGKMVEPEPTPKNPIKAYIQRDAEIAQRLFEGEQAQFEREQRIARERAAKQKAKDAALIEHMEDVQARIDTDVLLAEILQQEERKQFTIKEKSRMLMEMIVERKRFFAGQRAKQIRNKPPTKAQLRNKMVTYLKHMGKYTHNQMKSKSFEEIQKLYEREQKWINDFVPIDYKVVKDSRKGKAEGSRKKTIARKRTGKKLNNESVKRQKIEDDAEKKSLSYYGYNSGDDEVADGSSKNYNIFSEMLDDFDRKDVLDLYRLVKERFETASLEGYDRLLWGDLITVFELSKDDEIWKAQQDYTLIRWRLFDSCGVHVELLFT
ncbi:retrovirus-related pol polyprotein from transposon TNT 1-94, partial [Tanacetum coccineum]